MKKADIERMISLVDDRYIDEIFQDKITGRRKNIFVTFTAVAAALALVAGGISYFVSNAGNADKITADNPIVSEFGIVDYSLYFQNKDEFAVEADDWSVGTDGIFCYFSDSEYLKSVMPFDMSGFTEANCHFYYNYKDEVKTIAMHASNRTGDKQENVKMLDVEVYKRGELFPHLALGKCKSMKRYDVDVYGFDFREEDNTIGVIFAMDGKEYLIAGNYMSFDEIGLIMDSIIENGLWTENFDLSKAEMEYGDIYADITLEEANMIKPFAGHVPQVHKFGDMRLNNNKVSYHAGRDENYGIVPKWLYFTYYDGGEQDICLQYFTEDANIQPLEKIVAIENIELDKLSEFRHDGNNHTFTIDFGDFKVNVWTNNCNDNELLHCITAMQIGANGTIGYSSREISLIEANNIVPFAGYVPQVDNIGGMHLVSAYCTESSFNGAVEDNTIIFKYLQEETNKYITLHYTCEYADSFAYYIESFTDKELKSLEQQSELGDPDCRNYSFSLDCGDFRINIEADCAPDEMEQCIREISFREYKAVTLAEANKIEPYTGFVPQAEKVGDMKLGLVLYNGRNIALDYSIQGGNRFAFIGLTYTTDDITLQYNVIKLAQLIEGDVEFQRSDSDDDRANYNFAVDCGGFYVCIDGQRCTTGELYDCILTLLMEKGGNGIDEQVGVRMSNGINLVDSTLSAANEIKPFAGYIPQSESFGSLKLSAVSEGYFDGEASPCLIHMVYVDNIDVTNQMLTAHFYSDHKAVFLDEPKYSAVPLADLSSEKIKGLGKSFVVDCGDFEILIGASPSCSAEDIWRFIIGVKGLTTYDAEDEGGKFLTLYDITKLAEKGEELTWSDFDGYTFTEGGSGLYIKSYAVEGGYNLMIGGEGRETKPMYIRLSDGNGKIIDIRYDSVDEFLIGN